jgi:hypothetical protein
MPLRGFGIPLGAISMINLPIREREMGYPPELEGSFHDD